MAVAAAWCMPAFALLPCIAHLPPLPLLDDSEAYLSVHSFMEAFACAVSVLIAGVGWYADRAERSLHITMLSVTFLAVALLDFAHLLSYQGMPDMVTSAGPEKAIAFWLAARCAQALCLLGLVIIPGDWRIGRGGHYAFMAGSLAYTVLVYWVVLRHADILPRTFVPGAGQTQFKITVEYGVALLLTLAVAGLLARPSARPDFPTPLLLGALLMMLASELALTLYVDVGDNYNFIGHVYKVIAFWLIFRAVFVKSVTQPYRDRVASERLYRRLTEQAANAILQTDPNGRIITANRSAECLTGRSASALLGTTLTELLSAHHLPLSTGRGVFETDVIHPDGSTVPVEISVSALDDGGSLVIARDVSQRRSAEKAIRIRDISLASSVTPIAIADLEHRVTYGNQAFLELWGYDHESEILGLAINDFLADPERGDEVAQALLTQDKWSGELRCKRRDSSLIDVQFVSNLVRDTDGTPICMIGSFVDITERKRIEQERRRWADAFEHAAVGIAITDVVGAAKTSVNPAYAAMYRSTPAELTGRPVTELYAPESLAVRQAAIAASDRDGHAEFDVIRVRRDGSRFPARIWLATMRDNAGEPIYRIATVVDMTERKSIEQQLLQAQKMEAIGQLTGGVAHDFNNLLAVVIGNLDMLAAGTQLAGDDRDAVDLAISAAERGAALSHRLLAFARRQALNPAPTDVNALLAGMKPLVERAVGETVGVTLGRADDLWRALIDPSQLESAILNLSVNARDAMPQGGTLTIKTRNVVLDQDYAARHADVAPGDYVGICVSDTGTGIAPEVLSRVFEPFFTTKEVGKGSGLGLSMVFGFVKQSGGHMRIYSEPGLGTCITLYLPRAYSEAARPTEERRAAVGHGETILLVEDNEQVRRTSIRILTMLGYQVISAVDAATALTLLDRHPNIQLLLSDIVLPGGMNGLELARAVREIRPALPTLLASGFADPSSVLGGDLARDVVVLTKPLRLNQMAQAIRDALNR